ncbi:MAG: hypothetical protein ABSC89_07280 [Verrucomicrobiota bacterium]|jgi:hypothetical protein
MKKNQNPSGSVDPLAQLIVDTLRKSGCKAWLGFPSDEEREQLKAEKAERDFQVLKRREEAKDRHHAELKDRAREVIRRSRDEQV